MLATRFKSLEEWKGKTYNGGIFFGFQKLSILANLIQSRKTPPKFIVCRPGSSGASRLCVAAERSVTNIQFRQGVKGTTDNGGLLDAEQVNKIDKESWYARDRVKYLVTCVHTVQFAHKSAGECSKCNEDAIKRIVAVAEGLYSISITETIPGYGYGARYLTVSDGDIQGVQPARSVLCAPVSDEQPC